MHSDVLYHLQDYEYLWLIRAEANEIVEIITHDIGDYPLPSKELVLEYGLWELYDIYDIKPFSESTEPFVWD